MAKEGRGGSKSSLFGKGGTGWIEKPDGSDRKKHHFSNQKRRGFKKKKPRPDKPCNLPYFLNNAQIIYGANHILFEHYLNNWVSCKAYLGEASFSRSLAFLGFEKWWYFFDPPRQVFRSTPSLLSQGGLHRFPQAPFPSGDRGCNRPPVLRTASL